MANDFVIDFSCEVKGALRVEGMMTLVKRRNNADLILDMACKSGDDSPSSEIKIKHAVTTPQGIEQVETNVQEMLDVTKVLGEYENLCEKCPANVLKRPFGCFGVINYPIEAATLNNIGLAYRALGQREKALKYYEQALPIMREVGDRAGESITRYNLVMILRDQGQLAEVVVELKRIIELDQLIQSPNLERHKAMLVKVEEEHAKQRGEKE